MITNSIRVPLQIGSMMSLLVAVILFGLFHPRPVYAGGVVGDGTPGSCTEAAFDAARAGGGTVTFDCGGAKTINLTFYKEIDTDTII
ncbi:MAG TPA: hypothetical protein VGD99_29520, partial [Anaerolineae bacterium]